MMSRAPFSQLAQGGLDPLALGFQAAAPSHRSGLFCKDALNGVEVPLIFQLAAHIQHDLAHFDEVDGLIDEKVHPGQISLGHHLLVAHLRDHNELGPAALLLQLPHHLDAVLLGHQQVHQDQVGVQGQDLAQIHRLPAAVAAHDAQLVSLHDVLQDPDHGGVVLYNIDPHTAPFSMAVLGMVTRKQAPVASVPPGTVPGPLST